MKKNIRFISLCICISACFFGNECKANVVKAYMNKACLSETTLSNNNIPSFLNIVINNFNSEATLLNINEANGVSNTKSHHQQRLMQQTFYLNMSALNYFHSKINQTFSLYNASLFWGRVLLNYIRILQV